MVGEIFPGDTIIEWMSPYRALFVPDISTEICDRQNHFSIGYPELFAVPEGNIASHKMTGNEGNGTIQESGLSVE